MWLFDDPKVLRRAPCSGGWLKRGADGDIIVAHDREVYEQDYFCAVEAKCRKSRGGAEEWHFEQLLTSPKHPILAWWAQLCESKPVVVDKKLRLLTFSKTSGTAKSFLAVGRTEMKFFADAGVSLRALPKMTFAVGRSEDPAVETEILYFFSFRAFLQYVDPKPLQSLWRKRHGVCSTEN